MAMIAVMMAAMRSTGSATHTRWGRMADGGCEHIALLDRVSSFVWTVRARPGARERSAGAFQ
eukprot:scaffold11739_cov129-Isochrysis_galbana.AAC.5